jgi:hypothetical protein
MRARVTLERVTRGPVPYGAATVAVTGDDGRELVDLLAILRGLARDAVQAGRCEGYVLAVHPLDGSCDHEV